MGFFLSFLFSPYFFPHVEYTLQYMIHVTIFSDKDRTSQDLSIRNILYKPLDNPYVCKSHKVTSPLFHVSRLNPFKSLPLGSYIFVPSPRSISASSGDVRALQVDLRLREERNAFIKLAVLLQHNRIKKRTHKFSAFPRC